MSPRGHGVSRERIGQTVVVVVAVVALGYTLAGGRIGLPGSDEPPANGHGCAHATDKPDSDHLADERRATLCLLNRERRLRHLRPLRVDRHLERAAQAYSKEMAARDFFEHVAPDGTNPTARVTAAGYGLAHVIGENLGWGSDVAGEPAAMVDGWMHSPGHRANILQPAYREIGIGIVPAAPKKGVEGAAATYTTDFGSGD
jgi:uncharacterized protein YkwD